MAKDAGGWRNAKVVEYDTLCWTALKIPDVHPASAVCALQIPEGVLDRLAAKTSAAAVGSDLGS
jgi:hypothetical protein